MSAGRPPAGPAAAGGNAPHAPAAEDRAAAKPAGGISGEAPRDGGLAGARPPSDPAGHGDDAPTPRGAARPADEEAARAKAATAAGRMPGTTHDPNSVTTMTDAEPSGDRYPPKGTDDRR